MPSKINHEISVLRGESEDTGEVFTSSMADLQNSINKLNIEIKELQSNKINNNTKINTINGIAKKALSTSLNTLYTLNDAINVTNMGSSENINIESDGSIKPSKSFITPYTYGGAGTDNLDKIYLDNYEVGDIINLRATQTQVITVRDHSVGNGLIFLKGDAPYTLSGGKGFIRLLVINIFSEKRLYEISRGE